MCNHRHHIHIGLAVINHLKVLKELPRAALVGIALMSSVGPIVVAQPASESGSSEQGGRPIDRAGVGDTSMFAPLLLAAPTAYRAASGAPGSKYWQNRVDYDVKTTLDPANESLKGVIP